MKIFDLQCGAGHRFEGWFASADEFAVQRAKGLVGCPACGAQEVERIPSATRFNTGAPQPAAPSEQGPDPLALAQKLYSRMLDELLTRSEDVGTAFPAEARRIHYREAPERMIRGQASQEEHEALIEEGIGVMRLPIPPAKDWN
ncbi:MAG: DUF1178 family protein [Betaproteobacteria bacterium]|nr:DUF1178 family protein [Betaproteobacteria bacterium]